MCDTSQASIIRAKTIDIKDDISEKYLKDEILSIKNIGWIIVNSTYNVQNYGKFIRTLLINNIITILKIVIKINIITITLLPSYKWHYHNILQCSKMLFC